MNERPPRPVAAHVSSVAVRIKEFIANKDNWRQMRVIKRTLEFKLWACLAGQMFDVDGRGNTRERLRMRRLRRGNLNQGDV